MVNVGDHRLSGLFPLGAHGVEGALHDVGRALAFDRTQEVARIGDIDVDRA